MTEAIKPLIESCGEENVTTSMSAREHHSHDESYHKSGFPEAVVFPQNVEQVSEVAKICHARNINMIAFGTGTGLEGGVNSLGVKISSFNMVW